MPNLKVSFSSCIINGLIFISTHAFSACVCLYPNPPFYKNTSYTEWGPSLMTHLNLVKSCRDPTSNTRSRVRTSASLFRRHNSIHASLFLGDTIQSMLVFLLKALGMRTSLSQPERAYVHIFILRGKKRHLSRAEFPSSSYPAAPTALSPTPQPGPTLEASWGLSPSTSSCSARGQERLPGVSADREFSEEENMLFWISVWGAEEKRANKAMIEEAEVIYEDYISILS